MKNIYRVYLSIAIVMMLVFIFSGTAFAITESDVQAQIDASSREAVSGNFLIWFLCAIAFLKISQKIDSFMSSLGINVGHTGGNMLAEAMIAARGISEGSKVLSGKGFAGFAGFGGHGSHGKAGSSGTNGSSGSDGSSGGFLSGGLAGAVGRHMKQSAVQNATGKDGGLVGRAAFNSSLQNGGDFANNVIGSVAKGSISTTGTMTGEQATKGFSSYFGHDSQASINNMDSNSINQETSIDSNTSITDNLPGSENLSSYSSLGDTSIAQSSSDFADNFMESEPSNTSSFSNVEIGGGRITGTEINTENPNGIQFAMYNVDQYMAPDGEHSIEKAVDGSKWYRQYAVDAVEKTPYMTPDGNIAYNESIVKKLPRTPSRKDRI